jgi:cytochrome c-type biogenesis protein CcmH
MSPLFFVLAVFLVMAVTLMAVSGAGRSRLLVISAAVMIIGVLASYIMLGRPDMTRPQAASPAMLQSRALATMDETRAILERSEDANIENWTELANQYWTLGVPDKAAEALALGARIAKTESERDGLLGAQAQALITANDKVVGAKAQALFEGILTRSPDDLRALFFLGLAAEQAGNKDKTKTYWGRIIDIAPEDTPWRKTLLARLGQVGKAKSAQSAAPGVAKALSLPDGPQRDMIMGMVGRLAARLQSEDGSAEEWAKLGRSYGVLGRYEEALAAYDKALAHAPDNAAIKQARETIAAQKK